ncbi:hypothetical protein ICN48_10740 [Polynucleobacter sp. JS-Safj-400b-B2]|uniref:hypothetical protein n=1 Tax=Polynucleobacter sp. JS-Safj-400b-B2 TaxID=2576921 RepID=UPI001C0CCF3C|nr:hypothetical protein [Polynucleobacter sp. JS-Safj-400b-B2]MBU3626707.1 hypothetical protein [Polynucleobacter sp. JS-Safj-400b-B2]
MDAMTEEVEVEAAVDGVMDKLKMKKTTLLYVFLRLAPIAYWLICILASVVGFGLVFGVSYLVYISAEPWQFSLDTLINWRQHFDGGPSSMVELCGVLLLGAFLTSVTGMSLLFYEGTSIEFNSPTSATFHMSFLDTLLNWIKAYFLFPFSRADRLKYVRAYKQRLIDTRRTWLVPLLISLGVKRVVIKSHFFGVAEDRCRLKMIAMFGNAIESLEIGVLRRTPYFDRLQYFIFEWMGATIRNKSRTIVVNLKPITNLKAVK